MYRVLKPGALVLVNAKDFEEDGERLDVVRWHGEALIDVGFTVEEIHRVPVKGYRYGANREARIDHESIIVCRKDPF